MNFEDVKDLSITALIGRMLTMASTDEARSELTRMLDKVTGTSFASSKVSSLVNGPVDSAKS